MDIVQNIIFFVVYNLIYLCNYDSFQCLNIQGGGVFVDKEYNEIYEFWFFMNYNIIVVEFEEILVVLLLIVKFV